MTAFPKAAVQNVRIGVDLNVCLWPKADVQIHRCGPCSRRLIALCSGETSTRSVGSKLTKPNPPKDGTTQLPLLD